MASIIIGTTPTITFQNFSIVTPSDMSTAVMTITQRRNGAKIIITRDLDTATVDGSTISWTLTQAETLRLRPTNDSGVTNAEIQLNFLTSDGLRGVSPTVTVSVGDNAVREVIS